jgi:hypothetical protein
MMMMTARAGAKLLLAATVAAEHAVLAEMRWQVWLPQYGM